MNNNHQDSSLTVDVTCEELVTISLHFPDVHPVNIKKITVDIEYTLPSVVHHFHG